MLLQRCFPAAPEEKEHLGVGRPHPTCRGTLWSRRGCLGACGPSLFPGILSLGDTAFPCVHTTTWGGLDAEWNAAVCGVGVGVAESALPAGFPGRGEGGMPKDLLSHRL